MNTTERLNALLGPDGWSEAEWPFFDIVEAWIADAPNSTDFTLVVAEIADELLAEVERLIG